MKFDKDGVQQWVIQMGTASSDRSHDLSIDANQYIYPVMLTEGSMEGSNLGARDIALLQVDSSGTILSTDQFGTTGDEELPTSGGVVAVDPAGNLFITGVTDGAFNGYTNAGGYDLFVYKIDAKSTSTSTSTYSSNLAAVAKCEENAGAFSENKRKISWKPKRHYIFCTRIWLPIYCYSCGTRCLCGQNPCNMNSNLLTL